LQIWAFQQAWLEEDGEAMSTGWLRTKEHEQGTRSEVVPDRAAATTNCRGRVEAAVQGGDSRRRTRAFEGRSLAMEQRRKRRCMDVGVGRLRTNR
jgi:hypothetical protein